MTTENEVESLKAHVEAISKRLKKLEERISKCEHYQIRKKMRGWI